MSSRWPKEAKFDLWAMIFTNDGYVFYLKNDKRWLNTWTDCFMVILEDHGGDMYFENYFKPFVFLYNYVYNFKRLNFTLYILLNFEKNSYLNYLHLLTLFTLNINKNYLIHLILRDLIYTYNNITKQSQVINILFCLLIFFMFNIKSSIQNNLQWEQPNKKYSIIIDNKKEEGEEENLEEKEWKGWKPIKNWLL